MSRRERMIALLVYTSAWSAAIVPHRPRVAIVTGGTRGIGLAIARSLAPDHDLLLAYSSNRSAADACAAELRSTGTAVTCVQGDLASAASRETLFQVFDECYASTHDLTVLCHAAGQYIGVTACNDRGLGSGGRSLAFGDGSFNDDGVAQAKYYLDLYGFGFCHLSEMALQRMRGRGDGGGTGGSIVGVSSPGASLHYKPALGYDMPGTGKTMMEYAMRLYALRCASRGINCNVVIPGFTHTQAWERLAAARGRTKDDLMDHMTDRFAPMGAMRAAQIGAVVAFLCSADGRPITGVSLPVDGGVHLRI